MTLNEQITQDMKTAMKSQDVQLLSTIRMIRSAIQNHQIALGHEISDAEVMVTLEKQAKQRRDSINQYIAGSRQDLADNEKAELKVIESYLPQKMDSDALGKLVEQSITESGATSMSDMGKVIKLVMDKAAGAADGKTVSELVKEKLS